MKKINLYEPYSDEREIEKVTQVIKSGWWKEGPVCDELAEKFCHYTKSKHAIPVNSNAVGMDLLLKAYGIKDGEIIMPSLTFVAAGLVAKYNNLDIVFADVRKDNLTLDPVDVSKKVTPRTKAIMLQHMSGHPCDIDEFKKFLYPP